MAGGAFFERQHVSMDKTNVRFLDILQRPQFRCDTYTFKHMVC